MDYPFIPLPKWFIPLCPLLNGTEIKVMLVIFDQTLGWAEENGQRQTTNILAYTFLQNQTGITSRTLISSALKKLETMGLIKREPKRMHGQRIQVSVVSPIVPIDLVKNQDSGVLIQDSQSPDSGLTESSIRTHIKKHQKESFKESPTPEKLTPDQEESLAILVGVGVDREISRRLILIAWKNGRDSEYIKQVTGYVASVQAKNPPGMVRSLIEKNQGRIPTSNVTQGPAGVVALDKYAHGGKEHKLVSDTCSICHPELAGQEVQDA